MLPSERFVRSGVKGLMCVRYRTRTRQDIAPNAMGAADVRACACAVRVCGAGRAHLGGAHCAARALLQGHLSPLMRSVGAPSRRIAPDARFAPPSSRPRPAVSCRPPLIHTSIFTPPR
eukprot:5201476-Prymnesium_polylepis.1